jgi:hypothetical protein
VWLRLGNCKVADVGNLLKESFSAIDEFGDSEFGLLVLPPGILAG